MAKKLLLTNLLIMAGVLFLAQRLVASWSAFEEEIRNDDSTGFSAAAGVAPELPGVPAPEVSESLAPFLIIPEKNLFSEMRGVEPDSDEEGDNSPPPLAVKPKLTSVSLFGGQRQAVLTVFEGNRGARPETQVVKEGDLVQGYEVGRISDSEVGLFWDGSELHTIRLEAAEVPQRTPTSRAQAVRIITVGSAAAAVETVAVSDDAEDQRGVEVGVVTGPGGAVQSGAAAAGGRGNAGLRGGTSGRGQIGGRSQLGGRSQFGSRGGSRFNSGGQTQTPIGLGSARPSDPNRPPN